MTAINAGRVMVVPIRTGVGFRLGANIGYLLARYFRVRSSFYALSQKS